MNLHSLVIPLGLINEYRNTEFSGVLRQTEQIEGPVIVMGDFNLTDQQNLYKEITHSLQDAHQESGWGMGFTFTKFQQLNIPLWRIDYVFHSPDLVALHTTAGEFGASDHRPVIAELGFLDEE